MDHRDRSPVAHCYRRMPLALWARSLLDMLSRVALVAMVITFVVFDAAPAARAQPPCLCGTYTQIDRTEDTHPAQCDPTTYTCFNNGTECYQGDVCIEGICVAAGTPHKTYFYQTVFCCDDG